MSKEPSFTNANYSVCFYCNNLMVYDPNVASVSVACSYGCKKRRGSDGRHANVEKYETKDAKLTLIERGCTDFESSGLPAHPIVLEDLVKINPKTGSIPSDEHAS